MDYVATNIALATKRWQLLFLQPLVQRPPETKWSSQAPGDEVMAGNELSAVNIEGKDHGSAIERRAPGRHLALHGAILPFRPQQRYTLNLNSTTSPSCMT
jgi:hypothetical protein